MLVQLIETSVILAKHYDVYSDSEQYSLMQHTNYFDWRLDPQGATWWKMLNTMWSRSLQIKSIYEIKYEEIYDYPTNYKQAFYD